MFEIPEDIKVLSEDDLAAALEAALAEGSALAAKSDEDLTDEDVQRLEALAAFVDAAQAEQTERQTAASERTERLSSARNAFTSSEDEGGEGDDEDGDDDAEGDDEEREQENEEPEEPEKVQTASTRRRVTTRAARRAPKETAPASKPKAVGFAAADMNGFAAGQRLENTTDVAKAVASRLRGFNSLSGQRTKVALPVASIQKAHIGTAFSQANRDFDSDEALLLAASRESRLKGGSLVAAGGWGAPSETLLDFCDPGTSAEGILDIPEVTITRGGVRYTKGPSFGDVMESAEGFIDQTEAQAEAGTEKTALRPEVPGFTEVRLDATGVFVEAGLLLNAAWPELVEQYVRYALLANQHKVGRKVLAKIRTMIGAASDITTGAGNEVDILHVVEMVITGERERNLLPFGTTMEVLLPHWMKAVIRAGLANRTGVDFLGVTDAQIEGWFSLRQARVQWLYDSTQFLERDTQGNVTHFPDTVEAVIYPAGSYVKGTSDVITLETIYDSVNLRKNDFVRLFTEEGVLVTNPCGDGRRINVPLVINGRSAAADLGNFLAAPTTP